MNRIAKTILTFSILYSMLALIGIVAYQSGQYHRVAISFVGISAASIVGILWKTGLTTAFLTWFFKRKLKSA